MVFIIEFCVFMYVWLEFVICIFDRDFGNKDVFLVMNFGVGVNFGNFFFLFLMGEGVEMKGVFGI